MVSASIDVLYIAGYTRSGSTLLDRLLGQVGGLRSLGETRNIWTRGFVENELCGCGQRFRECAFWTEVASAAGVPDSARERARIAERAARLDRTRNLPALLVTGPASRRLERADHIGRLRTLYQAIRDVAGSTWLVDSSKQASYAALLTEVPGLRVHVVHLVRDSRAVAYSWLRTKARVDTGRPGELMPVVSAPRSALRWTYHNIAIELLRRRVASRAVIRYEDLVNAPERVLRSVLASAGAPVPRSFDFLGSAEADLRVNHTVSGNPDRVSAGPIHLQLDDEWTTAMRRRDRRAVSSLTAPLLARYGYRIRT